MVYAVRPINRGLLYRSQEVAFGDLRVPAISASECSMTPFAPLAELALRTLAEAEPGSFSDLDAAARHDLAYARSLPPAQRLAVLNDMLLAEAFGLPPVSREPIAVHGELLL